MFSIRGDEISIRTKRSGTSRKLNKFFLFIPKPFNSQDIISNSPYCLPYSSCDVSLENLALDQLIIP